MIISTSSYNVHVTGEIGEYVENTLRRELARVANHVVSVDVQLAAINAAPGRRDTKAVVRVDLSNRQSLTVEYEANNAYTAVRSGAQDAARRIRRQTPQSAQVRRQWLPEKFHAFGRYTAPNV